MPPSVLRVVLASTTVLLVLLLLATGSPHTSLGTVHASVSSDRAAGRTLFHEKGCEHCHGIDGVGGEKGPNLSAVGRQLKPDQIHTQILNGGDSMPAFADVLAPDEINLLVDYLSAKKKVTKSRRATGAPAQPVPKPDTGGSDDQ